jgi:type IV pilus assembly protein PilV
MSVKARSRSRRQVLGVSLLEVLISILLSAIGLLALAGTNVASIRFSKMSQYRGTAAVLAADLAERMRANKAGIASYDYSVQTHSEQVAAAVAADTSCEGLNPAPACTAATVATYDLNNWRRLVRSQLPQGSVFVTIVALPGPPAGQSAADVWIAWNDPAVANPDENTTDARNSATECPNGLSAGVDKSIRCSFFRINL